MGPVRSFRSWVGLSRGYSSLAASFSIHSIYHGVDIMKGYFGVHSRQSVAIHDTLGDFRVGRLPKQDVNRIIIGHLGDRIDLIKDYMSIANPQDVFIGSPGFQHHHQESAPSTPVSLVSPGFLQPQHQPRLTMPLWSPIQFTERTHHVNHAPISPELLRGPRSK
jgi:hypothetical protein